MFIATTCIAGSGAFVSHYGRQSNNIAHVALRQMRICMYRACRGGRHLQRYVRIVEHHK